MQLTEKLNTLLEGILKYKMDRITSKDYKRFSDNFLKLHKDNVIKTDKNGFIVGYRKGNNSALWRYIEDDMVINYDHKDDMKIMNFFDFVKNDHRFAKDKI